MKKLILIILCCSFLSGCSLLPKVNFNTDGTTPQATNKSTAKDVCKGKAVFDVNGQILSCSKGYSTYAKNYLKEERRYTLKEKIINVFRNLKGITFWIIIALIFLCPGLLGAIVGRLIEGTFGMTRRALNSTVRGIQKTRKEGKNLDDSLSASQDEKVKKYIRKIKEDGGLK